MGFMQSVKGQLIFFTAIIFQLLADLIIEVEGVAKDRKRHFVFMEQI